MATGYILLDGEDTDKNFYQFLELRMDDGKRTIETALRYSGPLRSFLNNYLGNSMQAPLFILSSLYLLTAPAT